MKYKEKQIEEMAMIMCEENCEECRRESIEFYGNSYDEHTQCLFSAGAERLYNAGYRKLDDHAIMVLRKARGFEERIRKETAREIYKIIKDCFLINSYSQYRLINELEDKYGVEVEDEVQK